MLPITTAASAATQASLTGCAVATTRPCSTRRWGSKCTVGWYHQEQVHSFRHSPRPGVKLDHQRPLCLQVAKLAQTFIPQFDTVYYIHNFKGARGGECASGMLGFSVST